MTQFESTPLTFLTKFCSICGIWPYLTPLQMLIRTIILQVSIIFVYLLQITDFLTTEFNVTTSLDSIIYMLCTFTMGIVYYVSFLNKNMILRYMAQIMEDWGNLKLTKEFNILLNYCTLCKKCIIIMMFSYNTYLSIMFLLSLKPVILDMMLPLNETRPHMLIIPMNWYNGQEKYFFKILILQYLALILLGFGSITGLSIYLVSLQYICAMFRIIGCLLDNILEDNEKKLKLIDDEVVYAKIIHIIHLHNKTVQFIDELNNKFNELYLALMACALVYYGISIDQLLGEYQNRSSVGSLIQPIFYLIGSTSWNIIFCYVGQHLQNVSEDVFCKAYEIPWYLLSKKSKKLLLFVIMKAERPSNVSIGKIFNASFKFFTALARLSISYGMILHSLR